MEKHVYVVLTNPVPGREDEYNDWYTNTHLPDVLKVPGIVAAQRFILSDSQRPNQPYPWKYLTLYDVETDDLANTLAILKARTGTPDMVISDALDAERLVWLFRPVTEKLKAAT